MAIITLKALADETRLKVIRFLLKGKKNVTGIVEHIGKSQPNISLALKLLQMSGVVIQEKAGRQIFYSLKNPAKIRKLLRLLDEEK